MAENHRDSKDFLKSPQAEYLLKNKQAMENLLKSNEARRLMEILNRNAGEGLKDAAQTAMRGDPSQLMGMVQKLMTDQENVKLVQSLQKKAGK